MNQLQRPMRILLTGGYGYLGAPITSALATAGHEVVCLSRSDRAAQRIASLGAQAFHGDLREPDPIVAEAALCDVFIHLAQDRGAERYETDSRLFEKLSRLQNSRLTHLIYTSTLFVLGDVSGEPANELKEPEPPAFLAPRAAVEHQVLGADDSRFVTTVIRPGMVYGGGEGGSVSELFRSASKEGVAQYVGNGKNRWSLVHRSDVAALYAATVQNRAGGILHAVDGTALSVRYVATLASEAAGSKGLVHSLPVDEARQELGTFADALVLDQPAVTIRAEELGWSPSWPSFTESADAAFEEWRRATTQNGRIGQTV